MIIEIKNATKYFKDNCIFKNVNISIEKGTCVGLAGYNGCGKSVLMKCICGFSRLTEGIVVVQGKIIGKDSDFIQDAGVVIESPEFINDLSGFKNLKIIANIQKKINEEKIFNAMKLFDMEKEKDKKVSKYSIGMKQKLRIIQAIMEMPSILILDEPTNGLDKESVLKFRRIINSYTDNGGTVVLASHNMEDISTLCDVVYTFEKNTFIRG